MDLKKIYGLILSLSVFILSCPVFANAGEPVDEPENLYARSAVLMDADSGRVLFEKDGENVMPMASTTKIMTCIVALENMSEEQMGTASKNAAIQPQVRMGVREGEKYYLKDLLYALMLESYNDSAVIIAEEIGGSVKAFTEMMDRKAEEIGCVHTHFVTPNGLDAEDDEGIHATTAADLALIMRYCIQGSSQKEQFLKITRTKIYQFSDVEGTRNYNCTNHNAFLDMMDGALSGKTGFTADAGYCYVGALRKDDRTFVVALLACGWPQHKEYKWSDTKKLMEYGLVNYQYREIPLKKKMKKIRIVQGVDHRSPYQNECFLDTMADGAQETVRVLMREGEYLRTQEQYVEELKAPVREGAVVGEVRYLIQDTVVHRESIVTAKEVIKRTYGYCLKQAARKYGM